MAQRARRGGSIEGCPGLPVPHEEMSELERTLKSLIPELARVHIDPEISNPH